MEPSDSQLIERINRGDDAAFAMLVDRYKVQVFNLMYRTCGCVEEAADMAQEVFCRVYEKLDLYREQRSFFSWLYTLALNQARDWARKKRFREHTFARFAPEREYRDNRPERGLEAKQEIEHLLDALQTLPEDRREMVVLRYRHDCSIRELADIFELSESGVKMRLKRALAELERRLNKRYDHDPTTPAN